MPVPTHGPRCKKKFCRPSSCGQCGQQVFHWACTCGSNVLFDSLGEPWPKHECTSGSASNPGSVYTYGVLSVVCARCGKAVRKRELDAHNYWTHGIGQRPLDRKRRSSSVPSTRKPSASSGAPDKSKKASERPKIVCGVCGQRIGRNRLEKHVRKAHPGLLPKIPPVPKKVALPVGNRLPNGTVSTRPIAECAVCSMPVRLDRLDAHMQRVHPRGRRDGG